jgi:hypothetical protein
MALGPTKPVPTAWSFLGRRTVFPGATGTLSAESVGRVGLDPDLPHRADGAHVGDLGVRADGRGEHLLRPQDEAGVRAVAGGGAERAGAFEARGLSADGLRRLLVAPVADHRDLDRRDRVAVDGGVVEARVLGLHELLDRDAPVQQELALHLEARADGRRELVLQLVGGALPGEAGPRGHDGFRLRGEAEPDVIGRALLEEPPERRLARLEAHHVRADHDVRVRQREAEERHRGEIELERAPREERGGDAEVGALVARHVPPERDVERAATIRDRRIRVRDVRRVGARELADHLDRAAAQRAAAGADHRALGPAGQAELEGAEELLLTASRRHAERGGGDDGEGVREVDPEAGAVPLLAVRRLLRAHGGDLLDGDVVPQAGPEARTGGNADLRFVGTRHGQSPDSDRPGAVVVVFAAPAGQIQVRCPREPRNSLTRIPTATPPTTKPVTFHQSAFVISRSGSGRRRDPSTEGFNLLSLATEPLDAHPSAPAAHEAPARGRAALAERPVTLAASPPGPRELDGGPPSPVGSSHAVLLLP